MRVNSLLRNFPHKYWRNNTKNNILACYHSNSAHIRDETKDSIKLNHCLTLLEFGLNEEITAENLKNNYVRLVQRYHPDTAKSEADVEKFNQICSAYKYVTNVCFKSGGGSITFTYESPKEEEHESPDIKHVAPQHRQFLEYDGIGSGTPTERQKFCQQYRFSKAVADAKEYQFEKTMRNTEFSENALDLNNTYKRVRNTQRISGLIERVVEDMIVSSMASGLFDNLKGQGKPLETDHTNPYIDETEKRINKILKNNGFTPLWIAREAELRQMIEDLRQELRTKKLRETIVEKEFSHLGAYSDEAACDFLAKLDIRIQTINKAINNYNLIAPTLERQFLHLSGERELSRACIEAQKSYAESCDNSSSQVCAELERVRDSIRKRELKKSKEISEKPSHIKLILKSLFVGSSK